VIGFAVKRTVPGKPGVLYRIFDGVRAEVWTTDGWKPTGVEWSGFGGSTDVDPLTPEEAVEVLRELRADNLNPTV
jgi:hypothetical protein